MYSEDYTKARKAGMRAYNQAVSQNKNPLLPVLEQKVPNLETLERASLGVISIPMDSIVGTLTEARAYSFAWNFMPIMAGNTEFATKWTALYENVQAQGVRDAIKVVEYMGSYYTVEGNKRVSVMKYMGADSLEGDVTRYLPPRSEDPEVVRYYAYCDFTKASQVYEVMVTNPADFDRLISLTGHQPGEKWSMEDQRNFRTLYYYFLHSYQKLGLQHPLPAGDAFLVYLVAYGYQKLIHETEEDVAQDVRKLRQEFEFQSKGEEMSLIMDKVESRPVLPSFLRPGKVKAAFLYTRSPEVSGWNYWHEIGRMNADSKLGDRLDTMACITPSRTAFEEKVEELYTEGYRLIFATSPVMLNSCIKPALEHPDARYLCCSLLAGYQNVSSYYLRFYEAKFLMGMVAGISSKNGKIGYIADYPIYGLASTVNAFALGAHMVNPDARIYLNWSTRKDFNEEHPFWDPEIRIVCNRDINAPRYSSREYGLYERLGDGSVRNLAAMLPDWSSFYTGVIDSFLKGTFGPESEGKARNYWWGMNSRALDVVLSSKLDPQVARLIQLLRDQIEEGDFTPFVGELRDNNGTVRLPQDRQMTPAEVLTMDYFVDNVVGIFPPEEDLIDSALPIVRLQGLGGTLKRDASSISWKR